jgi:hypothetical protein
MHVVYNTQISLIKLLHVVLIYTFHSEFVRIRAAAVAVKIIGNRC